MGEISDRMGIHVGDIVTITDRFNTLKRGKAIMFNPRYGCWILNMGGKYGRPAIADETNIVHVKRPKRKST